MGNVLFSKPRAGAWQKRNGPPTLDETRMIGDELDVNWGYVSAETLHKGTLVEMEHGLIDPRTNVTGDDWVMTAKIALAHLNEHPDYYELLERLEQDLKQRVRPTVSLFLPSFETMDV